MAKTAERIAIGLDEITSLATLPEGMGLMGYLTRPGIATQILYYCNSEAHLQSHRQQVADGELTLDLFLEPIPSPVNYSTLSSSFE